jgi:hypothetical protein
MMKIDDVRVMTVATRHPRLAIYTTSETNASLGPQFLQKSFTRP